MAQITIIIPDEAVGRIKAAFGKLARIGPEFPDAVLTNIPATILEIEADVKRYLRSKVIEHEVTETATLKRAELSKEVWDDNI